MQINKISSAQNFGMDIKAPESFWSTVKQEVWETPDDKSSKKLFKEVRKIINTPSNDVYEIEEIRKSYTKENNVGDFNVPQHFMRIGYKLINKTKNITVLEKFADQRMKLNFIQELTPANFVHMIAQNLNKIQKLEKNIKI